MGRRRQRDDARIRELLEDRERLAEAQRIAHIGSWEWDVAADRITWSDELYRLYGLEPAEPITFDRYIACLHPDDRDQVAATVARSAETGEPFVHEHRAVVVGAVRWVRGQGCVEREADGRIVRMRGTGQDITDMRQATEQFRELLESAPDATVIVDGQGRIARVNRQLERIFGYRREQLVGQPVEVLMPERLRHRHVEHRQDFDLDPRSRPMGASLDLFARRADGSEFPVEISLSPLTTDSGVLVSAAIRDISERRRAADQLAYQALHDSLTGLPNRLLLADRLEHALGLSGRTGTSVAVVFVDLDRFKLVNDSRGHAAGDELLIMAAHRLSEAVRECDTVARFGGDEFVIICEGSAATWEATQLAERVTAAFGAPFMVSGDELFVTVSLGIAVAGPEDTPEGLLRDADAAMYRAKERGRARCELFDETMRTEAAVRLETQSALHRAVERDELRVFYQPVIDLQAGRVAGLEALVRWQSPQLGLVGPAAFIPLAEDAGLIVEIGEWVLEEAARQWAEWRQLFPLRDLSMNVNLSARQLRQPLLVGDVRSVLQRHGLPAGRLCLELTESAVMEDVETHPDLLAALHRLGVRLAIDDFGTGYSSLSYLKRLPVDTLKIDQGFVAGLGCDPSDTAIVQSVIALAHALRLQVVAEGVETHSQMAELTALGCDLAQGYYLARPLPAAELTVLLAQDEAEWLGARPVPG